MEYTLMLRELREARGMTQRSVADGIGVQPSTVALLELGLRNPSMRTLIALADLLDCTTDRLLGRDGHTSA